MKKITPLIIMLLTVCLPSMAQSDLNVYQDELIIKTIPASDVDSVTVTESEPRSIFFWRDGEVFLTFASEEVDSITLSRDGEEPFSYIGIVGFNDDLYVKDIDILSSTTASKYKSFVNSLSKKNGTLLYFAVDNALAMMLNHRFTTPLTSANLITFTDGLDLGSIMKNTNHSSSSAYLSAVSQTIRDAKVQGLPLSAYTVGLRGSDVRDVSLFRKNLRMLASSDDKAFEISSINDLQSKFKDIADEIIRINTRQTISVKIPGTDSGTRSRFVFDGKSAENSQLYIEGSFNLRDFTLRDVTYHGMTARSGSVVQGTLEGIFVTFTLRGLQNESGDGTIPMSDIKHYYRLPSSSSWQINSEFTPSNNTLRSVMHKGTSVMLVLDCSSSLGSDFSRMQSYANSFIDMVANNALLCDVTTPQNVKAEFAMKSGNLVVRLTWDKVRFAESYDVYRSSSSSGTYSLVASDVTTLYWFDESPLEGISYYKIVAKGHGMTSAMSNAVMARKPFSGLVFNVNGIDINMVKVEGGTFQMGATSEQESDEYPAHSVTLSDYWIGETEVTQTLWQAVMGSNPSYLNGSNRPVEQVSWNDCQTFVNKLNSLLSGQLPAGRKFRLPTEAEWEFAARGGNKAASQTKYAGSDNIDDVAWYYDNSYAKGSSSPDYGTHDVATKSPNALGIYDMSGNVWEWCQDRYGSFSSDSQTNPTGPSSGSCRVRRGGSWYNDAEYCRVSIRDYYNPSGSFLIIGLRVAL